MRRTLSIAKREYISSVRTKGFLIGLFVAPLLMCGSIIGMVALQGQVDVEDKRIAVLDRTGRVADVLVKAAEERNAKEVHDEKTERKLKPAFLIEPVVPDPERLESQRLELSDRVRGGELHAFVEIGPEVLHPPKDSPDGQIRYHAKGAALDEIRGWVRAPINDELRRMRLAEADVEEAQIPDLFAWLEIEPMGLVSAEVARAKKSDPLEAVGVPIGVVILMWIMIMMGAMPLLNAVMEEKSQRIAEVLLGCATPFELMFGKLLGSLGVALTGSAVYILGILFVLFQMGLVGVFPFHLLPWFLVYVVLAILMVGANSVALGAACNDAKDAQNLTLPTILPVMIPMFLLGPMIREPNSAFAVWASFIPPFTPMMMLMRQAMPTGVPFWHPWVGLLGVLAFTLALVWAAARVFRVGLLMQGKPPQLGEIVRWALRG